MRLLFILCFGVFLAGCGTPQVDVKTRWNQTLVNYSFVPIYPARGDVDVGDVRIHTIRNAAEALDSRLIANWNETGILSSPPRWTPAVLPGLEAVRSLSLDSEATGLTGVLRAILGSRISASNAIYVSLQELQTAEVADRAVAHGFHNYLVSMTSGTSEDQIKFIWGLCAAAKTLGDPKFKGLGISIVTRVIRAKEIVYYSGSVLTNVPEDAKLGPAGTPAVAAQTGKSAGATGFTARNGSSLPKAEIGKDGVIVGVDALMIQPNKVLPELAETCEEFEPYFLRSQLQVLKGNRRPQTGRD